MKGKIEAIKQILYVLLPMGVFIILYDVWTAMLKYVLGIVLGLFGDAGNYWAIEEADTLQAICIMGGMVLSCWCLFKTALTDVFLMPKKDVWKIPVWRYVLLIVGTVIIAYGLNYLFTVTGFSHSSENYQNAATNQYNVAKGVGILLYGVVSPFVEEVIFRGFLYGRMRVYMPKVWAVLVSSLLFGVYHGNVVQGVYGFLMGILFALVYDRYKNFYLAVIMHAIVNFVGYFVQLFGFI
ncbi:MAG: CPBP family intramembrane metalloprotease [Lachnospiraceae bacterium]|nr:CPBP family intramembrane metalloprotease [Lachnospiraceae bacterium]